MDIRQLSYFVEVVSQKNISNAAQRINITQSALSQCIQSPEQEFDINLFVRERGKTLTLTEEDQIVLEDAKDLLVHYHVMQKKLNAMRQGDKQFLSIGFSFI